MVHSQCPKPACASYYILYIEHGTAHFVFEQVSTWLPKLSYKIARLFASSSQIGSMEASSWVQYSFGFHMKLQMISFVTYNNISPRNAQDLYFAGTVSAHLQPRGVANQGDQVCVFVLARSTGSKSTLNPIDQDKKALQYFQTEYPKLEFGNFGSFDQLTLLRQSIAYLVGQKTTPPKLLKLWSNELVKISKREPTGEQNTYRIGTNRNFQMACHFGIGRYSHLTPVSATICVSFTTKLRTNVVTAALQKVQLFLTPLRCDAG
ncbi:hypothetical protein PCASD_16125 [Puccinia coronata f. sp. avenae]|uniref:Uncharacterized protein n=1 Tax=Puccinia coronata f. sp. avenae TaxID=200324 RepID=A0A2N5SXW8_9BASI|nr:hypothetical protein PCASD_16125 [Puccinia coronata f. sp. avenae]